MTKEKLLKKRKRDICLVVVFAVLIVLSIVAAIITFSFQDDERVWITLLGAFFCFLFFASIALTVVSGMWLNEDNEKLTLIKYGVSEEDVEEKYKSIKEKSEDDRKKEWDKIKDSNTTLGDLKKSSEKNMVHTSIFGLLTGVTFIVFLAMLMISNGSEEETSDVIAWVGVVSFLLFIPFLVFVCVWGYKLNQDKKKINRLEKYANKDDEDISVLKDREFEDLERKRKAQNERSIELAKQLGLSYYYDKDGYVQTCVPSTTTKKGTSSKRYSVFDDHEWEHDVFHDDDLRDDDIMDFMDDDY